MNKRILQLLIALGFLAYIVIGVHNLYTAHHTLQIKEIKLRDTNAQLKELQLKYDNLNSNLDEQLKAKQADQQKIQELEQQRQELEQQLSVKKAQQASNKALAAVTGTKTAIASSGWIERCQAWANEAGIVLNESALKLLERESHCNPTAWNASSGAGGIPQALPFSKTGCELSDAGAVCQLRWFNNYVMTRYGSFEAALAHSYSLGWY